MTATDASAALAAIRAREQAATGGPWVAEWHHRDGLCDVRSLHPAAPVARLAHGGPAADAEFIAHARTDVPRMAAALDAVLALCDEPGAWTRMDTREAGEVYNANTVDDFVTDLRAAIESSLTKATP